jgi:hypothetical protein
MSLNRRGLGLAEVVVALALTGVIGAMTTRLLLSTALRLRDRSERMAEEHALRVAAGVFRAALESLGHDSAGGADLLSKGISGFSARAVRAVGVACFAGPGLLVARADTSWWRALRDPVAGRDSILAGRLDNPSWRVFALQAAPSSTRCPDGSSAIALPIAPASALAGLDAGSPLLVYETVELRQYSSAPDQWLGARLLGTAQPIQPFAGPMTATGLALTYLGRNGLPALFPADVAAVDIRFEAITERAGGLGSIRGPAPRPDSLQIFVALGNPP